MKSPRRSPGARHRVIGLAAPVGIELNGRIEGHGDETGDLFAGAVLDPYVVQGIASSTQMTNLRSSGNLNGGF